MPQLPKPAVDPVGSAIYEWYRTSRPQKHRAHLGGSQIGVECDRALWYQFRWADTGKPEGRMIRLWRRGWDEEPKLEEELEAIGIKVESIDPATGEQFRVARHGGHFGHGADGKVTGVPLGGEAVHLAEYKTANDKNWKALKAKGLKVGQPKYYDQTQTGMLVHGLERCLFISVNKNDDSIYTERVKLDRPYAEQLLERAGRIIFAPSPPVGISEDASFYKCKWCDMKEVCHYGKVAEVNCRTCVYSSPTDEGPNDEGPWRCDLHPDEPIPEDFQRTGCPSHVFHPALTGLGEVVDASDDLAKPGWVQYGDGTVNGDGGLSSADLRAKLNGPE